MLSNISQIFSPPNIAWQLWQAKQLDPSYSTGLFDSYIEVTLNFHNFSLKYFQKYCLTFFKYSTIYKTSPHFQLSSHCLCQCYEYNHFKFNFNLTICFWKLLWIIVITHCFVTSHFFACRMYDSSKQCVLLQNPKFTCVFLRLSLQSQFAGLNSYLQGNALSHLIDWTMYMLRMSL